MPRTPRKPHDASAPLGYQAQLWQMADSLRGSMDAADYKHVVLGLIFLKCISDSFVRSVEFIRVHASGNVRGREA